MRFLNATGELRVRGVQVPLGYSLCDAVRGGDDVNVVHQRPAAKLATAVEESCRENARDMDVQDRHVTGCDHLRSTATRWCRRATRSLP